jgi:hypothetical protein
MHAFEMMSLGDVVPAGHLLQAALPDEQLMLKVVEVGATMIFEARYCDVYIGTVKYEKGRWSKSWT